jgi:trans-AT polyketide synthase/acyltransferase/oxidoreductase domain-containing protein
MPVLSNVTARPHEPGGFAELLARQIAEPVRWTDCVRWLLALPAPECSELGPGNVLTGLVRRVRQEGAP